MTLSPCLLEITINKKVVTASFGSVDMIFEVDLGEDVVPNRLYILNWNEKSRRKKKQIENKIEGSNSYQSVVEMKRRAAQEVSS